MLETIYPEEEHVFFTSREHLLALLGYSRDLLTQGVRKHLALSGFRRVGKTVVLKEFLRRSLQPGSTDDCRLTYIDLPRLAFTPEAFAVQYLGYLLYWVTGDDQKRVESLLDPPAQLAAVGRL